MKSTSRPNLNAKSAVLCHSARKLTELIDGLIAAVEGSDNPPANAILDSWQGSMTHVIQAAHGSKPPGCEKSPNTHLTSGPNLSSNGSISR